ncbi:putative porin [Paraburkholderia unamae]|uniref:porin n=1 Tax=Paraburkholderia unamae TaxID=219649 RepID=UPI000DC24AE7|nr:porin [Paraburkholderia unamae]RAR62453.1 putative porin [Paraburkholderia unamae]
MKKVVVYILAGLIASPAFAQSSVTLYGIVDNGITYVSNSGGKSLWEAASGTNLGSRWGLKGSEELGGGLKAIFILENGFNSYNGKLGQGGLEFGRQAWVGLSHPLAGKLTMGRQYDSIVDYVGPTTLNLQSWGGILAHANDIDNTNDAFRVNNSVKYVSPTMGGFTVSGMYAFGGVAGQFGRNSTIAGGASYAMGNLYVAAGYLFARNPGTQFPDGNFVKNGSTNVGVFGYVGQPASEQVIGAGTTYRMGRAIVGANYTNTRFAEANGTTSTVIFDSYEVWSMYNITPALLVGGGYNFVSGSVHYDDARPKYHQINLVMSYALSKRTDLVLNTVVQHAAGGAHADIYNGVVAQQSSGVNQVAVHAGLRHRF